MDHGSDNITTCAVSPMSASVSCAPDQIPSALTARNQWVVWRYAMRKGKWTKVPFNARTGHEASSTDPSTWSTFAEAVHALGEGSAYDGVGFVFSADDPYCGVDLDDCIIDGMMVPEAQAIIDAFSTYTEISPSGNGVKLIIIGAKPPWARCKSKRIEGFKETEVYDDERYFTLTGRRVESTPAEIAPRQKELEDLCHRLWPQNEKRTPPAPQTPGIVIADDQELLNRMFASKHGEKIRALWGGDTSGHDEDASAADLAMCNHLAFWSARDKGRMDRLFRGSGLYRQKWDRTDYRNWTLDKAIIDCREVFGGRKAEGVRRPHHDDGSATHTSGAGEQADSMDEGLIALGQRDPATGRLVLSPRKTLPTAEAFITEFHHHADGRTLHSYAGTILVWRGNRFVEIEEESLRQKMQPWLHSAQRYVLNKKTGELELVDFESNPTTINAAVDSLRTHAHLPITITPPAWLTAKTDQPDPRDLLPCLSGNLHIPTGQMLASTPALFNINALDFDYDPQAEAPERWIKFLEQLWGDDLESVELLQEWMGYCLVADTSLQKMLLLVGPRRSGKGTIGRIITKLAGAGNVVGPTTSSLAGAFGLQPLIGKSLAIVSDARFSGENISVVVERLLCVSGEDTLTVDRKFLGSVTMRLPTRFMFLTNELPRMNDSSAALAGRFVILRLTNSFYGQEDPALTLQLTEELPGILLWALDGLKRLRTRGHFVMPQSVAEAVQELEDLASPVLAFVRDRCVIKVGTRVWVDNLYAAWKSWCEQDGRTIVTNKQTFGRDLAAAVSGVVRRRGAGDVPFYDGISLKEFGF